MHSLQTHPNLQKRRFVNFFKTPENRSKVRLHLSLIPFDILVIVFIAHAMTPAWALFLLAAVNFGTWWCYYRIPQFLRTVSGSQGDSILIPGPIVDYFARFIHSCGIHHRAHYGLMLAMMAGFHTAMTGKLGHMDIPASSALIIGWLAYGGLLMIDVIMFWVSLRTLQEMKKDSLKEANIYAEELKRSNKDLEEFAYIASHDLRAPLNAMRNLTNWISEDLSGGVYDADTRKHLSALQRRITRLDRLLNDLLKYARVGHDNTDPEYVSLHATVQDIFSAFNVDDTHILQITGDDIVVFDYSVTYEVLMVNLIGNAFKHNDKNHTHIGVHMEQTPSGLSLVIEDNGPGIPQKYSDQVFKVFSTLKSRDELEASGMGLAIVKKIIAQKGGSVTISEGRLGGAAFNITLPIAIFAGKPG